MNTMKSIKRFMSRFIETIQFKNGKFTNLELHQERIAKTIGHFYPCDDIPDLKEFLGGFCIPTGGVYRFTVSYSIDFEDCKIKKYHPRRINRLFLVDGNDIDYGFKYADRAGLEFLARHCEENEDIIMVKNGLITDASYANLVFSDGNSWKTPLSPLLPGTKRKLLLEKGIIKESVIRPEDLESFKTCSLINAMLDPGDVEIPVKRINKSHLQKK